jgi:3,4-dehydroadipyl-CoA semialdehyde dehydrogenase
MAVADVPLLKNYLEGRWVQGKGTGLNLLNPTNGDIVASCSTDGIDFDRALAFARTAGGPALRALTISARAALVGKIADILAGHRDRWFEIARINSGNTKADASIDVDGAIGTLKYFSKLGMGLGDSKILVDSPAARLARDPNFQASHIGVPLKGVAVHINAYNFPAWGLWEKVSVSLLSGVPVFAKPASATAWLAQEMVERVIESGVLPQGALSIACGPAYDLLEHLQLGDVVCFTGSAATGGIIRRHPVVLDRGIRVNIEADSLNAAILGPDTEAGSPAFEFFAREVVREMTVKTGQKCTAIRRILVPAGQAAAALDAIRSRLQQLAVGDPANSSVGMGPLVDMKQRSAVEEGIRKLSSGAEIVYQHDSAVLVDADATRGAFSGPALLRAEAASTLSNELEVFGPVATLMSYQNKHDTFSMAEAGGGSLAASVFSADPAFLEEAAIALGPSHGRILLVDPSIGDSHTGHGIVMPSCTHGGPGRAGGGEELGGLRGLWFYHQRVAVQGSASVLGAVTQDGAAPLNS